MSVVKNFDPVGITVDPINNFPKIKGYFILVEENISKK